MPHDLPDPEAPGGAATLLERALLLILFVALLLGVLMVLWPFATAILFGSILAVALWPLRDALVAWGMRRGLAATLLLLLMVVAVVLPLLLVAPGLAGSIELGVATARRAIETSPAAPPPWIAGLPVVGAQVEAMWAKIYEAHGDVTVLLAPYGEQIRQTAVGIAAGLADSALQIVLSLVVAALVWTSGEAIGGALAHAARRIGGETGLGALRAAEGAVRSVAYGVVGTSIIQAILQGIGLWIAGVPFAGMLAFLTLLFSISQILGPLVIVTWAVAAWWLFDQGSAGWGLFMILWGALLVSSSDNVVRPLLIRRGVQMPLSLIVLGVFGGFVSFGFLGLFIGPTLLAVAYVLLQAWRGSAAAAAGR